MLKGYTKAEKSWMLYDWANSAFATIIAAIILPIFFKEIAHQNGVSDVDATAFWGYATSCGTLICGLSETGLAFDQARRGADGVKAAQGADDSSGLPISHQNSP